MSCSTTAKTIVVAGFKELHHLGEIDGALVQFAHDAHLERVHERDVLIGDTLAQRAIHVLEMIVGNTIGMPGHEGERIGARIDMMAKIEAQADMLRPGIGQQPLDLGFGFNAGADMRMEDEFHAVFFDDTLGRSADDGNHLSPGLVVKQTVAGSGVGFGLVHQDEPFGARGLQSAQIGPTRAARVSAGSASDSG